MNPAELYRRHAEEMEDFWHRRQAHPKRQRNITVFGQSVSVTSNDEAILAAVDHAVALYTRVAPAAGKPQSVQLVVQPAPRPLPPAPDNLMQQISYTGHRSWLMMGLSHWGHAWIDLEGGLAVAVLAPELAARPRLVSQCLLHTILLNFSIARGLGLLHASCLVEGKRALLLLGPHNVGKSTTSLQLAQAGFKLLTDSMVFVDHVDGKPRIMGFPVGKMKLRRDVLHLFPQLGAQVQREVVREETKFSLDLRATNRDLVHETAASPTRVDLCLLSRHDRQETLIAPASETTLWSAIMGNSLFFDNQAPWIRNLEQIKPLVARARAHQVTVGKDAQQLVHAISGL